VGEMLHYLSHKEYIDWIAYFDINKFPDEREDLRAAVIASAIIDSIGGKDAQEYKKEILSLLDVWKTELERTQTPEQVAAKLKSFFAAFIAAKGKEDEVG
jgi:hypothetical protein